MSGNQQGLRRMRAGLIALAVAAGAMVAGGERAAAAPEPKPVPTRWQLDVRTGPLRVATVEVPGEGPQVFYYLTYRVVNNSGDDLLLAPIWELATDEGDVLRSGRDVPLAVSDELLRRLDSPLLHDQIDMIGMLLQGEDNARDGLVVWPAPDMDIDAVQVFGAGFSGETDTLEIPDPRSGESRRFVLRKSLMLRYEVPGTLIGQGDEPLAVLEKRWIMR